MHIGWLLDTTGHWYFLNPRSGLVGHNPSMPEGAMLTGSLFLSGTMYFLNPRSTVAAHRRELPEGAMRTGRIAVEGLRDASGNSNLYGSVHDYDHNGRFMRNANPATLHLSGWWPRANGRTTVITYRVVGSAPNLIWGPSIQRGRNYWNNSSVPVRFESVATSDNTVSIAETHLNHAGSVTLTRRMDTFTNEATFHRFALRLYSNTIEAHLQLNPSFTRFNVAASVMAHEIGHVLGIRDNPASPTLATSVMSNTRNRNIVTGPNQTDIAFANFLND